MKMLASLVLALALVTPAIAIQSASQSISGNYLEVRSCDVYTGPCFANAEMGLSGRECIMVWSIQEGAWQDVSLAGMKVIAVVRANDTLGDLRYQKRHGKAVLIVDAKATRQQQAALTDLAQTLTGDLISEVVGIQTASIESSIGACHASGCANVQAGDLVSISTRCLGDKDHLCGNEETFYPPLTQVHEATPAYTEVAAFQGKGLNSTWQSTHQRSAFIATFQH